MKKDGRRIKIFIHNMIPKTEMQTGTLILQDKLVVLEKNQPGSL